MNIYHTTEPFDNLLATDPSETILQMEKNMPEIFEIFCTYQKALVAPYLKRDGIVTDDLYDSLLPVAANLVIATALTAKPVNQLEQEA